jgi:very-short-patch-repair endonuclease
VHRLQLSEAGIGRGAIAHRLRTGWLHEPFPSVYRVAGAGTSRSGRIMAAALFFRGNAVVCGIDAAALWELLDTTQNPVSGAPISLLLVGRSYKPRPGLNVHRIKALPSSDIRWRNGIPVTSPARTILDLGATMDQLELEAALLVALRRNLARRSHLTDVMERNPQAKGIAKLRQLLEQPGLLHDTRSKYERKLLKLLEQAELPRPITNTYVAGKLVDAYWSEFKLVLEFDGWQDHGKRGQFETDRLRDQHLLIAGHHVMRITARQVDHSSYALVARIAGMIATLRFKLGDEPVLGLRSSA